MSVVNRIMNTVYGTKKAVNKFQLTHLDEHIIAVSGVKGIISTPKSEVNTGVKWILSRRAVAILTNKRIKCGDWDIPLSSIKSAELIKFRGLISKGQLLNISTKDNIGYQLGMQRNMDWLKSEHLILEYVDKKIKISTFSWVMRIVLVIYLIIFFYERFIK